jgi:hypothetical protein
LTPGVGLIRLACPVCGKILAGRELLLPPNMLMQLDDFNVWSG